MIKEKKSVNYLTFQEIEIIYRFFFDRSKKMEEPVPDWSFVDKSKIINIVAIPQKKYFDLECYPTLEEKAAIIFYEINKGHIFPNGNKRMSVFCLLVFLSINDYSFEVSPDEMRNKALELAKSEASHFEEVINNLILWIQEKHANT